MLKGGGGGGGGGGGAGELIEILRQVSKKHTCL